MKKMIFLLSVLASSGHAGTITVYQDFGGNIGSVVFVPAKQVFIDSDTSSGLQNGVGNVTWNMAIGAGINRALVVGCALSNSESISTVSIGGFALTLATANYSAASVYGTAIYISTSPPSGAQGIIVETVSGIMDRARCWAQSYTGVDQSHPIDVVTTSTAVAGTATATLTTTLAHSILFDVVSDGNADGSSPGANQTAKMALGDGSIAAFGSYKPTTSATAYTMTWAVQSPSAQSAIALRTAL